MASNTILIPVKDRRFNGFENLFRKEGHHWFGTWQWVIQILIWMTIINGMLAMVVFSPPSSEAVQVRAKLNETEVGMIEQTLSETALRVLFIFSGLIPGVGAIIIGQDAILQERQTGTAAWVLSKPVSRAAFLLSKLFSDAVGMLVTMVLVPGLVAYIIYKSGTGIALGIHNFLGGLGLNFLLLLFYFSLTFMLGTIFHKRGPVIGIPLGLSFGNQLAGLIPFLGKIMPWNLVMDLGPEQPALAVLTAQGQPLPTLTPILGTVSLTVIFVAVALWKFGHEEF